MSPSAPPQCLASSKPTSGAIRLLVVGMVAVISMLAGCGGDDADATKPSGIDGNTVGDDGGDQGASSGEDAPASGDRPLVVEVGDRRYELEILACSVADNGSLVGTGSGIDTDTGAKTESIVDFRIQPEGSPNQEPMSFDEQHYITISDADAGLDWNAGSSPFLGGVTFEHSYVDSWTLDGMSASGSASFIEQGVAYGQDVVIEPEAGTFEFRC